MKSSIFTRVIMAAMAITLCAMVVFAFSTGTLTFGQKINKSNNMMDNSFDKQVSGPSGPTIDQPQEIIVLPGEQVPEKKPGVTRIIRHITYNHHSMQWILREMKQTNIDNSINTNTEIVVELEDSPITVGDDNTVINDNLNDNEVDVSVDESVNDSGNTETNTVVDIDNTEDNDVVDVDIAPETTTPDAPPTETTPPTEELTETPK